MGFIMEFAENLVLRLMEDPEVRDRKAREHIYEMHERCKKIKEMWALPIRPYGFWTFERHNAQLRWDPQISQVAGTLMMISFRTILLPLLPQTNQTIAEDVL
ncbi:LOW QUALITY PROTEIN: hypothetical protein HID58_027322 [Brassica napus]|uniref:Uncharacterized protein n=1 Tax=Brassica napus TaxID=3708 RepID=A0ABQ8CRF3_BRANA|nr:LOW QUALITY PROTEIN: hypothetical protein HID58_027322 [Brassica napus]